MKPCSVENALDISLSARRLKRFRLWQRDGPTGGIITMKYSHINSELLCCSEHDLIWIFIEFLALIFSHVFSLNLKLRKLHLEIAAVIRVSDWMKARSGNVYANNLRTRTLFPMHFDLCKANPLLFDLTKLDSTEKCRQLMGINFTIGILTLHIYYLLQNCINLFHRAI